MSDPVDARTGPRAQARYDPPDSPLSVGWTRARRMRVAEEDDPVILDCGERLAPVDVEFETYGTLSPNRDNAVVIGPALSGGAHAAGWDAEAADRGRPWQALRPGWWDDAIGPGKGFDTGRYFVICASLLGGCYGTTGPADTDPRSGAPYGSRFPFVTVGDWVEVQARLLDRLGIDTILGVAGGSLGGQQAIEWGLRFPDRVRGAIVLAASPSLSAMGIGLNLVAREAIENDPNFAGGDYYGGPVPTRGLGAARMLGHMTYVSSQSLERKFARRLQDADALGYSFAPEFQVESYLHHQARSFAERFDANSYLRITRAMDYYDAATWGNGDLVAAAARSRCRWLVVAFRSDWLYPPEDCRTWVTALEAAGREVEYVEVPSTYGHDAFLLEVDAVAEAVGRFLSAIGGR